MFSDHLRWETLCPLLEQLANAESQKEGSEKSCSADTCLSGTQQFLTLFIPRVHLAQDTRVRSRGLVLGRTTPYETLVEGRGHFSTNHIYHLKKKKFGGHLGGSAS